MWQQHVLVGRANATYLCYRFALVMEPPLPVDRSEQVAVVVPAATVLFDQTSAFSRVMVVDDGPMRMMRFGSAQGDDQSGYRLDAPRELAFEYSRVVAHLAAHAQLRTRKGGARYLLIGVGGGSLLSHWALHQPRARVDAVEIDPVVVTAARRYFPLPQSPRIRLLVADGAAFVSKPGRQYDAIVLDAFGAGGIPDALATPIFYAATAARLAPGGVVIANVALVEGQPRELIVSRLVDAFGSCVVLEGKADENWIVIAGAAVTLDDVQAKLTHPSPGLMAGIGGDVAVARTCVRPRTID
jgi:spermidine synthase